VFTDKSGNRPRIFGKLLLSLRGPFALKLLSAIVEIGCMKRRCSPPVQHPFPRPDKLFVGSRLKHSRDHASHTVRSVTLHASIQETFQHDNKPAFPRENVI